MNIHKKLQQCGFTLIELLVVISIVSLLSSVTLASTVSARAKTRDTARIENLHSLEVALELYYNKYSVYPCGSLYTDGSNQYQFDLDLWHDGTPADSFLDSNPISLPVCSTNPTKGLVTESLIKSGFIDLGNQFTYYQVTTNRQQYMLMTAFESASNFSKMTNDGGLNNCYYEIGPGVGWMPIYTGFAC